MPWKETRAVDERTQFIAAVLEDPRGNFTRLCARFGISRNKGYKWVSRYQQHGPGGLEDQKSVARTCPHRTADMVVGRVVELRKQFPFDGAKKLRARLLALPDVNFVVPAASTIGEILDRYGLIRPRRMRLRTPPSSEPLGHATAPNHVWCTDFKGHFACRDGTRCHPLTISDAASRYLIKCEGLLQPQYEPVRLQFERAFHEFGIPERIRSDNGPPFATNALGGLSHLSVWWVQLGIVPERIEPGKPQQNGRHERMHRTLKEQTASPPSATLVEQQRSFDRFRADYNEHRPHEALGQVPPARVYEASARPMPARLQDVEYASEFKVRRVQTTGQFDWKGTNLQITKALGGQRVGLRQTDEDEWELFYGPLLLGFVLFRDQRMRIEPMW
jgi:putative transposase